MMQEEDYMEFASEVLSKMRRVLEGAVTLFEDELCPVYKLIRESGECTAMLAFDDIGTALSAEAAYHPAAGSASPKSTAADGYSKTY